MIKTIHIKNFKSIRQQKVDLEPFTLFVGANASGKTSVLEAMHLLVRAATGDPKRVFGYQRHCDWLYTRGGSGDLELNADTATGSFGIVAKPPPEFPPSSHEDLGRGIWEFESVGDQEALADARSMVFLHLNATELAKPSYTEREPPRVEFNGEGLASVLAYMLLSDRDRFDQLEEHMREFVPQLKRIRIRKTEVRRPESELFRFGEDSVKRRTMRKYQGEALLFDFENAKDLSANTVSEGTLMLLGLLTVLLGPSKPNVLLMDDIEHGLHPAAQRQLIEVVAKVRGLIPDLQIVATSHSPYLLDWVQPDQIRVVTSNDEGHSVFGKITDHPDFEKWKDEMTPGELWSLFGEQWITKEVQSE